LGSSGSDLRPQDLFSWSSAGIRNRTSSGTRYFSINGGTTNIVNFNQNPNGDFGDWLSTACPQAQPYVQNAFACQGQYSDVAATSPEGINLDVIGYDLVSAPVANADIIWQNTITGQRVIWIMNGTTLAYGVSLPTEPTSWSIAGTGDFNRDGKSDIIWQNTITGQRLIWIMNGTTTAYGVSLPTEPIDWSIAGTGDFNGDGNADIIWQNTSTGQRLIWIMNGTTIAYGVSLPTEPTSWSIAGTGDFNGDSNADIVWQNTSTGQRLIWIMNGTTIQYAVNLPTEPTDWSIAGVGGMVP
jgi:FG-GAP-like repeat